MTDEEADRSCVVGDGVFVASSVGIPKADGAVLRSRRQPFSRGLEVEAKDGLFVFSDGSLGDTLWEGMKLNGTIWVSSGKSRLCPIKGHTDRWSVCVGELSLELFLCHLPEVDKFILAP